MAHRETEAGRLRAAREIFERALRDNVSMEEAKKRIQLDRIELRRRAIAAIRGVPLQPSSPSEGTGSFYWQQGQYE